MIDEQWLVVLVEDDTTWLRLSLAAMGCNWNGIRQGELDASMCLYLPGLVYENLHSIVDTAFLLSKLSVSIYQ